MGKYRVRICRGPSCGDVRGSSSLAGDFERALVEAGLSEQVELCWQSCYGRCAKGPNVLVRRVDGAERSFSVATPPSGGPATMYNYVTATEVRDIVVEHLMTGRPLRRLLEAAKRRAKAEELSSQVGGELSTKRDRES